MKMPKHLRYVDKYNEFIRAGGGKSGVYDISDLEIYTVDKIFFEKNFISLPPIKSANHLIPKN